MRQIATKAKQVASGVRISMGSYQYEINEALRGSSRWPRYDAMQTDPYIKGSLRFNTLPLLAAEWSIVPASDKARDKEVAEFAEAAYLCKPTDRFGSELQPTTSWRQRLFEILDMLPSGYAAFARSGKRVGGKVVFDKLKWLEPSSIDPFGWKLDDEDNIVEVRRTFIRPSGSVELQGRIDPAALSLFVWELKGARYEGCPFIRSMWGAYFRKDAMLKYLTIGAQRFGAPSVYASYPKNFSTQNIEDLREYLEQVLGTAPTDGMAYFPADENGNGVDVKFAGADVDMDRMRSMIDGENLEYAHAGGTKAQMVGETKNGSRSAADTVSEIDLMCLGGIATAVCDFANNGVANLVGDISLLVRENYPGIKEPPQLQCSRVHPSQGMDRIDKTLACVSAGITPVVPELCKQITETLGYKLPDDAYKAQADQREEDRSHMLAVRDKALTDTTEDAPPDEQAAAVRVPAMTAAEAQQRMAPLMADAYAEKPPGKRRGENLFEARYMNLSAMNAALDGGERRADDVLRRFRAAAIAEVVKRVAAGKIDPRNMESQRRSKSRAADAFAPELRAALVRTSEDGAAHVRGEVEAQRSAGKAVAA